MAFDYHHLKNWKFDPLPANYHAHDTMLYALGIGLGMDPLDRQQLRFVYEKNLLAMPSMAVVLAYPGFWMKNPATGVDWVRVLHGEQRLELLQALPAEAQLVGHNQVTRITDKGPEKGALVVTEKELIDANTQQLVARLQSVTFCRGDGGLSQSDDPLTPLPPVPERAPDMSCELASLPQAALLYRLNGDYNPLHADPQVAQEAGFERPILHGLCTYGMACHALVKTCADYNPHRLKRLDLRFSAPVYPGETLAFDIWTLSAAGEFAFQARVPSRDNIVVLSHGVAAFEADNSRPVA